MINLEVFVRAWERAYAEAYMAFGSIVEYWSAS